MAHDLARHNRGCRLAFTCLENRITPAQFGNPWADPTHLTLSFAPDGTTAAGVPSTIAATLDGQMPRAAWQAAIVRAFQTWAEVGGVNVGVASDSGLPFGTAGATQGDRRFGDIRIGAVPMAGDALAEAIPPDPLIAGTLAGDVFFNTNASFTPDSLYAVALHEAGHALGIGSSTDPKSVMSDTFTGNTTLLSSDVASVRTLYGARAADLNEGSASNDSSGHATRINYPGGFTGSTPLVAYGDITTKSDVDYFSFPVMSNYSGPLTVRLQTTGVSLGTQRLTVIDSSGTQLARAEGSGTQGDTISITLPRVTPGANYYLRVEAAPGATFGVGRYGMAITFDGLIRPTAMSIDQVLRGPYDSLGSAAIDGLFRNPSSAAFNDDRHHDDDPGGSVTLTTTPGYAANTYYTVTASLSDAADLDFYRVRTPSPPSGGPSKVPIVLTASVRAVSPNGTQPRVQVFDENLNPVPSEILANGDGTFTIQATKAKANSWVFVRVGDAAQPGNYALDVGFGKVAADVKTFSTGTVNAGKPLTSTLYVAETQAFGLTLTANGPAGSAVEMTVTDSAGRVVFDLTASAGDTVSGVTAFLAPGEYHVRMTVVAGSGPVTFSVSGNSITDPIGPQPADSTLAPQYQNLLDPNSFLYPNGTVTTDPFLWLAWSVA
jgi:Matrixin